MPKTKYSEGRPYQGHLSDRVVEQLLSRVKKLVPGAKLSSENELSAEFKVSRTVVREAISQLKSLGILTTRQGAGIFVAPPSQTTLSFLDLDRHNPVDIIKFMEIRSGLDAAAARLAASRRTKPQLDAMRESCQRTIQSNQIEEAVESDSAFHLAIVEATANEHFVSLHNFLSAQLKEGTMFTRRLESYSPGMEKEVRAEHSGILKAIEDKDEELAAKRAAEHMLNGQKRLKHSLSRLARRIGSR